MRIEYEELGKLRRWPGNPKDHDLVALGESLDLNGYVDPVLIDEGTGLMVKGHGRLEKLEQLKNAGSPRPERILLGPDGTWLVPVVRGVRFKSADHAAKYVVADNRISELGGWGQGLPDFLSKMGSSDDDLFGTGFGEGDLVRFMALAGGKLAKTVDEYKDIYDSALVKQIVLYFEGERFGDVVRRLSAIMTARGLSSNTEVVMLLLEDYERVHARSPSSVADSAA